MHDIIIIGAGVIGCSVARVLSVYNLDVLVLEKENDVCEGASKANSAILHSGYDPKPNTLKAKYNVLGNPLFDNLCKELDISISRCGSITIATNEEEVENLYKLKERAKINNVEVEIISKEKVLELEPNINPNVLMGLLAPTAGIINPFELCIALMENAMDNGVKLNLNEKVIDIKKSDFFHVSTIKQTYSCKCIINCSGVYADEVNELLNPKSFTIMPRRGEYIVLDHFDNNFLNHVIFTPPTLKGKGVLITPTTANNYLIGPSSNFIDLKDDVRTSIDIIDEVKEKATKIINNIPFKKMIKQFAGIRAVSNTDDFIIEETSEGFINVAGIQSPGLVSSYAIAIDVFNMIKSKFDISKKSNYSSTRRKVIWLNKLSEFEKLKLIKTNKQYSNIICRCENVSEGEIRDAINRNCGATSIMGVKKRVRPGFGKCQGSFCQPKIVKILSEELRIDPEQVLYNNEPFLELKSKKL